jgi:uncharacterized protein
VEFFEAQGVRDVGCNFDEAEGAHHASTMAGHEAEHEAFVADLVERTATPGSSVRIRELMMATRAIAAPIPRYTWNGREWPDNAQVMPFALVNVAWNGDFSTFSPELLGQSSDDYGNFVLGNVAANGCLAAARTVRFARMWNEIVRGVLQCERDCAHFNFCGGGAPANKLYENGTFASAETLYCRTMVKRPFDAVLARLESASAHGRNDRRTAPSC